MATGRGCVWEVICGDTLVITFCDDGSTPEQWRGYVSMLRNFQGHPAVRFLIYAETVPPRDALGEIASAARGQPWRVALISPSTAVRFAASTFSFVAKNFRFFAPDRVKEALVHLHCDDAQQQLARDALTRMRGSEFRSSAPH